LVGAVAYSPDSHRNRPSRAIQYVFQLIADAFILTGGCQVSTLAHRARLIMIHQQRLDCAIPLDWFSYISLYGRRASRSDESIYCHQDASKVLAYSNPESLVDIYPLIARRICIVP
jgi:hypothetical protein